MLCLVFIAPIGSFGGGTSVNGSAWLAWGARTFDIVRDCLGSLKLVEGRGTGLRCVAKWLAVNEPQDKLTHYVTMTSDLPSEALDGPSYLIYLATITLSQKIFRDFGA